MKSTEAPIPLVLLVDDQDSSALEVENVLKPRGHVVLRAATGQQAINLVGKVSPDAVLVSIRLPDCDGVELIRHLKESSTIHPTTPVISIAREAVGRADRLDALSAGAWHVISRPIDSNELILQLDTFIGAKQSADRHRDEGLTDHETGFFNVRGILQRAKEISADASRHDRPLTCVAFGSQPRESDASESTASVLAKLMQEPVASALRRVTRLSDTIGCLGPGEFVVLAPGTDQAGALRLADRVLEALDASNNTEGYGVTAQSAAQVRAGFCAIGGADETTAEDLLLRATLALRRAQADDGSFRVRAHDA